MACVISRIRQAALAARRQSSGPSASKKGGPHRPMMQSPTILSKTPPVSQTTSTAWRLHSSTSAPMRCGSLITCSLIRVKPEMSQKRMATSSKRGARKRSR